MLARRVAQRAIVWLALFSHSACAFFDPPWLAPTSPIAGEAVSVNIRHGICDSILGREGFPQITRDGNDIHIVYFGVHYEPGDELCVFGVGTVTTEVGTFPAGAYTLTADLLYDHPVFGPTILNIGVVSFTVSASTPVPTIGVLGALALVSLLLIVAVWHGRTSRLLRFTPISAER